MKKIISFLLIIILLIALTPNAYSENDFIITDYKSEESEKFLWETLNKYTDNPNIAAGIMGYFWRESFFKSSSVVGWATNDTLWGGDACKDFMKHIDIGLKDGSTRDIFIYEIHDCYGGFGLGQWYSYTYLEELYDFAQEWGTSIVDAEMQCAFIIWSIQNQRPQLWEMIKDSDDPHFIGLNIGVFYDGTSVGGGYMGDKAEEYYDRYFLKKDG